MLTYMMSAHGRTPAETIFVGDQEADREAAMAAGCDFLWAEDFFERRIP
jgi:phosphoglycolate phosphatase-like HAD superfamily hydrolase